MVEVLPVYIGYACLVLVKESLKWDTVLNIYAPVQSVAAVAAVT